MNHDQLRTVLRDAGCQLYRVESYDLKRDAQANLTGRTHYADDATLRFFRSRIVGAGCLMGDTIYYIIESLALEADGSRRGFRGVVFDVFGTTVYRPGLDECVGTSDKARNLMREWISTFDAAEHYSRALTERATRLEREAAALRAAVAKIDEAA